MAMDEVRLEFRDEEDERDVLVEDLLVDAESSNIEHAEDSSDADNAPLIQETAAPPSVWTFGYYQSYFDVDTDEVLARMKSSCMCWRNDVHKLVSKKGDLYGPFWISTTLIFVLAVAGNVASYFAAEGNLAWHYDFKKSTPLMLTMTIMLTVTVGATVIYSYVALVPLLLSLWMRIQYGKFATFFTLLGIYGYAMTPFVPVGVVLAVPLVGSTGHWVGIGIAFAISAAMLAVNVTPIVKSISLVAVLPAALAVVAMHFALCVGFKLYFFQFH